METDSSASTSPAQATAQAVANPEFRESLNPTVDEALRRQVQYMFVCLLVLTASVALVLGRQTQLQYQTIKLQRPAVMNALNEGLPRTEAAIREFRRFGAYDTNFANRILSRHGLTPLEEDTPQRSRP